MKKLLFWRRRKPFPTRLLLLVGALLNGLLAAVTFRLGMGFYEGILGFEGMGDFASWGWCLSAVPGAVLLYYWLGRRLCQRTDWTRRQLVGRGIGWGSLIAFGNVPLTMLMTVLRILPSDWEGVSGRLLEFLARSLLSLFLGTAVGAVFFAPVAIFCGLCLGWTTSLVVWHGHVAPQQREILRSQGEHPTVPDEALSRASPPGEPQATSVSLSLAETAEQEEPSRLATTVEEAPATEEQTVPRG